MVDIHQLATSRAAQYVYLVVGNAGAVLGLMGVGAVVFI